IERRTAVGEAGVIVEAQRGRTPVEWILRCSRDPELRGHIQAAGKIWRALLPHSAEGVLQVVDDLRGEGVRPRKIGIDSTSGTAIDELEEIRSESRAGLISQAEV